MGLTPMKRDLDDVPEVQLDFMGFRSIRESIERLLRCGLNLFDNSDDFVNCRLVDQTARSVDEQANVLVKLDIRWQFHCSLPLPCWLILPTVYHLLLTTGRFSAAHSAAHLGGA